MPMLKVMTVVGTRPEIIKLSRVIPELDKHTKHVLVHTGQNFDYELNEIFFNKAPADALFRLLLRPQRQQKRQGKVADERNERDVHCLSPFSSSSASSRGISAKKRRTTTQSTRVMTG